MWRVQFLARETGAADIQIVSMGRHDGYFPSTYFSTYTAIQSTAEGFPEISMIKSPIVGRGIDPLPYDYVYALIMHSGRRLRSHPPSLKGLAYLSYW
jgi:hypothetical protein